MARRNINRYKRIYPVIRKAPRYVYEFDGKIEFSTLAFNATESYTYSFTESYKNIPSVVATASTTSGNEDLSNVNVFIKSISNSSVTIGVSDTFTGNVFIQVIGS